MNLMTQLGLATIVIPFISVGTLASAAIALTWLVNPLLGWTLLVYWLTWGAP